MPGYIKQICASNTHCMNVHMSIFVPITIKKDQIKKEREKVATPFSPL